MLVEDCLSIGRAFGGGAANIWSRPDEPSVFRRCQLWCLDWWGDAAGAYVRAEHPALPNHPDGFVMACESNDPRFPAFTIKFATSTNLTDWTKMPDTTFGTDRYAASPTLLYYSVGDQRTWSKLKRAVYPAPLREFFDDAFAGGAIPAR